MDDTNFQPIYPSLPSTVGDILTECPKFRILVMGKTGCGKSSLINKVFGVDIAQVSHRDPGKADIDSELCPEDNAHFILHDSRGFGPGEEANFNTVKDFIEKRSKMPQLKDRPHAIWVCSSIPLASDRVTETGAENILKVERGNSDDYHPVPLIAVFTKYDIRVTSAMKGGGRAIFDLDEEKMWLYGEKEANGVLKEISSGLLLGKVPVTTVSTQSRYSNAITRLIEITDKEVRKHLRTSSRLEPPSLSFAVAQRGNANTTIGASIDVGRQRYWTGLLASTDFSGKELKRCLDIIHGDIISVWNLLDRSNYLAGDHFKAKMSLIVEDLYAKPNSEVPADTLNLATVTALAAVITSPASIAVTLTGVTVLFAKWVFDVYQNSPSNIASVMGYIVDLTIVMHRLSTADVSEERVASVLTDYAQSSEIAQVHNDIRQFVNKSGLRIIIGQDYVLQEIVRLIENHCLTT